MPRDPDRCGQGPRGRVRRSKPDAISRMVALGVVESHRGCRSVAVSLRTRS